jgi:hypothetical protein
MAVFRSALHFHWTESRWLQHELDAQRLSRDPEMNPDLCSISCGSSRDRGCGRDLNEFHPSGLQ